MCICMWGRTRLHSCVSRAEPTHTRCPHPCLGQLRSFLFDLKPYVRRFWGALVLGRDAEISISHPAANTRGERRRQQQRNGTSGAAHAGLQENGKFSTVRWPRACCRRRSPWARLAPPSAPRRPRRSPRRRSPRAASAPAFAMAEGLLLALLAVGSLSAALGAVPLTPPLHRRPAPHTTHPPRHPPQELPTAIAAPEELRVSLCSSPPSVPPDFGGDDVSTPHACARCVCDLSEMSCITCPA